ncbi:MAG: hypothetical protein ACRBF0_18490 [Calditrichia bacterium]
MLNKYAAIIAGIMLILSGMLFAKGPEGSKSQQYNKGQDVRARTLITVNNWEYWLRNDGQSAHTPDGNSGGIYPGGTASTIYQDGIVWGARVNDNDPSKPEIRVGGQTYNVGTTAGYVVSPGPNPTPSETQPIWRIRSDWRTFFDGADGTGAPVMGIPSVISEASARFQVSPTAVSEDQQTEIIEQYRTDWQTWPTTLGAPFYDVNGNGAYDEGLQEDLNGNGIFDLGETEEPGIANADQIIWYVNHDLDEGTTVSLYGSPPIGLEIRNTIWAYNQPGATLGQLLFKQYTLINKSGFLLDSMYLAQWSDPDVGTFGDDLVGSDSVRSLGFAYSGFLTDSDFDAFGLPPAAGGYDFFQGPLVDGVAGEDRNRNGVDDADDFGIFDLQRVGPGKINLPQLSFGYFAAGSAISDPGPFGDYEATEEWYNLLNGFLPNDFSTPSAPFLVGFGPRRGQATRFPAGGDPVSQTGDIDAFGDNLAPGDRRLSMSAGPFEMQPGDVQQMTVALIGGIVTEVGGNNRNAVAQLKLNDDFAQFVFDNLFQGIPSPPADPVVTAVPFENSIMLDFGSNAEAVTATEAPDALLGFDFEGYNIYQLPTATSTKSQATKVATIDVNNTISSINAAQFVPSFGDIVTVPVQVGTNTGIKRFFVIERDYINGTPLYAGNEYYFAVTAYNAKDTNKDGLVDTDVPEPSLESGINLITVVPQGDKPGERRAVAGSFADIDVSSVASDGAISVQIIDPTALTGDTYAISFFTQTDTTSPNSGADVWQMTNETKGEVVITDQPQLASLVGNDDLPFYDGFQLKVSGPPTGINTTAPGPFGDIPADNNGWNWTNGDRWISGTNWGGVALFGGMHNGTEFFGSTITAGADFDDVELRWAGADQATQPDRWQEAYAYERSNGYALTGIGSVPFTAWNTETGEQLTVAFVEDAGAGSVNSQWDMGWDGSAFPALGGREYIFIMSDPYGTGPSVTDPLYSQTGILFGGVPCLYAIWPASRGSRPYLHESFDLQVIASNVNTDADVFRFTTSAITFSEETARRDLDLVNVFPNPYYAYNPEETSRFNRFVTFTHLPQEAVVRIFSIAGTQVRKLDKNDDSQFLQWDLRNQANLPVASGFYVAHIELPSLNAEKTVKLFIVQGDEILDAF